MNEHDQSRKFANATLAKGTAAAEQTAQAVQQSLSVTVENLRDFNLKMIDMAQANTMAVFEFSRQLATAKQPADFIELWTAHAKKQFETISEQTKELSALGQKIAGDGAEPLTRGVGQAFKKAS
jgi:phasin